MTGGGMIFSRRKSMTVHGILGEIGKAVINKGLKEAQKTGRPNKECVNELWEKVFGKDNGYEYDVLKEEPVDWQKILETLV